jgi:hypothetical protein
MLWYIARLSWRERPAAPASWEAPVGFAYSALYRMLYADFRECNFFWAPRSGCIA